MNKVIISGRITRDIEVNTTANGKSVCNFSVAVKRDFKSQSGEYESDFFDVKVFGEKANALQKFSSKGSRVIVTGSLQNSSWEVNGDKKRKTEIFAENIEYIDFKDSKESNTQSRISELSEEDIDNSLPF